MVRRRGGRAALLASLSWAVPGFGAPGDGIHLDHTTASPYADASLTHDSNVYRAPAGSETADRYFEAEAGVRLARTAAGDNLKMEGNLFSAIRQYDKQTEHNSDSFGDFFRLRKGGEREWRFELSQSFRKVKDIDRHATDVQTGGVADDLIGVSADLVQDIHTLSIQRDTHQFGFAAERPFTDRTCASIGYRYSSVIYDSEDFFDLSGHLAQLDGSTRLTERTGAFVSLRAGLQGQEGMSEMSTFSVVRGGLQSRGSDKLVYKAGIGFMNHRRPAAPGVEGADGESQEAGDSVSTSVNYDASVDWFVSEKVTIRAGAYNGIQMSSIYRRNGLSYVSAWIGGAWRATPQWILSTRATYRMDDYLDPVPGEGGTVDRSDLRSDARLRVDYTTRRGFLRAYAEVLVEHQVSSIEGLGYDGFRLSLGLNACY